MRPDVKLGIVISTVFVTVAGTYFLVQDRGESAIPVSPDDAEHADIGDASQPIAANPDQSGTARPGTQRTAAPAAQPKTFGVQNPPVQTASRRNSKVVPSGNQRTNATPTRDRRASPSERLASGARAKRRPTTTPAQSRRSRDPEVTQRKQARRKQPKPQLALTATPATGMDTAIERHRVQAGDTMALLAKQYYGSTQFDAFLIRRNQQLADPAHPRVGEVVNIVPRTNGGQSAAGPTNAAPKRPNPTSSREYRVKSGDSFYRIARDVLGDAKRWNELYEMNKKLVGNDPTKLQIGQVIVLPGK